MLTPAAPAARHPDVHVGEDGWLFLIGGSNWVARQYRNSPRQWRYAAQWCALIIARALRATAGKMLYRHIVVPEKVAVYDNRLAGLPLSARLAPARRLRTLARCLPVARGALLDIVEPLRASRDGPDLYLRTDSHWSFEGCLVAYRAICRAIDARPRDFADRPSEIVDCMGDLGAKLTPRPPVEHTRRRIVLRDAERVLANPLVTRFETGVDPTEPHVGTRVIYRNPAPDADRRTVLLFGDSYAHYRADMPTGLLTTLLAETFREVHFAWSTSVDWAYVDAVRPDILLTEASERFMPFVPRDGTPVDTPALALRRGNRPAAGPGHPGANASVS